MEDKLYLLSAITAPAPSLVTVTSGGTNPAPLTLAAIPEMFFIDKLNNEVWFANASTYYDNNAVVNLNIAQSNLNYIQLLTKKGFNKGSALYKSVLEPGSGDNGDYVLNRGNYPNGCSSLNYAFSVFKSQDGNANNKDITRTYINYGINYVNKKYFGVNRDFFTDLPSNYFPRSVSYYNSSIYILLTTVSGGDGSSPSFVPIKIAKIDINDNPENSGSNPLTSVNINTSVILSYNLNGGNSGDVTSTCDNNGNLYITMGTSSNNTNAGGVYKFNYPITGSSVPEKIITNDSPATSKFTTIYYSSFYNLLYVVNQTSGMNVIDLYYTDGRIFKKNHITIGTTTRVFMDEDLLGNLYFPSPTGTGLMVISTIICFKEDTKIMTKTGYKLIQELKKGDLVKTLKNGYKAIYKVGHTEIDHQCSEERIKNQLYKCSSENYPELFEDLIITGCHCILVDKFKNEKEREKSKEINNINVDGDYMTETKFRLPACVDERTTVYEVAGVHKIYHLALENDDYLMNYGIYANGLLVESTSKRFMDETLMIQND
jgi:hypothetical protein